MRVLILTSYKTGNIYKVNHLTERHDVIGKIIERPTEKPSREIKMRRRYSMIKKYGVVKTINRLLFSKYKQRFFDPRFEAQVRQILFPGGTDINYTHDMPTIEVPDINSRDSIAFIKERRPDAIAVCGTSLIRPDVFQLAPKGTINIHSGITPEYRSNESIFWALYNNEPEKVGVTIHYVDAGIDTGSIIHQQNVPVTPADNLATLYCKCQQTGVVLMSQALNEIEREQVKTIKKENVKSKAYFSINLGILQYLFFLYKFNQLKKML